MTQPYSEFLRHRACGRKVRHDGMLAANAEVLRRWARGEWAWRYPCAHCGGWHVHTSGARREDEEA